MSTPSESNPYATPATMSSVSGSTQFAACPSCGASNAKKISYTWWGGAVGPAIISHVKCLDCKTKYNGKTGRSNFTAIVVYQVVAFMIGIVCVGGYYWFKSH